MNLEISMPVFQLPAGVKDEVTILPFGRNQTVDGLSTFDFTPEDAPRVIQLFKSRGIDLLFDYEHQSIAHFPGFEHFKAPDGRAPAAGWGGDMAIGDKGLVAKSVRWTQGAADAITSGEYRYQSPVVIFDPETGRVKAIQCVALTNEPRLKNTPALAARCDLGELLSSLGKESSMDLKAGLVGALALKTDANDQDVLSAVNALKNKAVEGEAASGKIEAFKTQQTQSAAKVTELEGKVTSLTADVAKRDGDITAFKTQIDDAGKKLKEQATLLADTVLNYAIETGRIAPAAKDGFKTMIDKDPAGALTAFKSTPIGAVVPIGRVIAGDATVTDSSDPMLALKSSGVQLNESSLSLDQKAKAYQAQHKCNYATAVAAVERAGK